MWLRLTCTLFSRHLRSALMMNCSGPSTSSNTARPMWRHFTCPFAMTLAERLALPSRARSPKVWFGPNWTARTHQRDPVQYKSCSNRVIIVFQSCSNRVTVILQSRYHPVTTTLQSCHNLVTIALPSCCNPDWHNHVRDSQRRERQGARSFLFSSAHLFGGQSDAFSNEGS